MMMVTMMTELSRHAVDMAWKLNGAVGKAMGHTGLAEHAIGVVVGMLLAGELMEAFYAQALHLVGYAFSGCFGFGYTGEELGEDAAEDISTFGVRRIGGGGDRGNRVDS